jgi:alpha-L-rhamnosidase
MLLKWKEYPRKREKSQMFKKAYPIFAANKEYEMNTHLTLRADLASLKNAKLRIAVSSFYQLFVNDRFVAFGPCRAAGGYARVDEFLLDDYHNEDGNTVRIEAVGYACRSLSTVYGPSFVCAEILCGDDVAVATGTNFDCYLSAYYEQKTERYSGQRHFTEIYDAREDAPFSDAYRVKTIAVNAPQWLERKAPYSAYREVDARIAATVGVFKFDETLPYMKTRASFTIDERWGHYEEEEILHKPYRWIQRQKQEPCRYDEALPLTLCENEYAIFDLGQIESGLLRFAADVAEEADVVVGYTELCAPDHFEFTNINCQNVLEYFLPKGKNEMMSFEPYTARLAIVFVKKGTVTLERFGMVTVECDMGGLRPVDTDDASLRAIYDAAVRTFAQNASDIYMDCPSRERAGWLCDSYFEGIAEYFFLGKSDVETAFLENYRLYENDGGIPAGALPMCYPSDLQNGGRFIPQWNMWYVLEVRDYILKRGHAEEKEAFRASVMGVLDFLSRHENEDGLLEDLPSWNFVEWSKANDWTQNVNYPTNFLYVGVLLAAYDLYGGEALRKKALAVREKTKENAFNGEVFIDHAVRDESGALKNTKNFSEAGQYYAMLFGDISLEKEEYQALKHHIENGFSDFSEDAADYGFVPVNAFIGRYLRMQTLLMLEKYELLIENIRFYFSDMAKTTGTLWEYKDGKGSKTHGFASFVAVALAEALEKL